MSFYHSRRIMALYALGASGLLASCSSASDARPNSVSHAIDGIPAIGVSGPDIIGGGAGPEDDFVLPLVMGRDNSGFIYVLDLSETEMSKFGRDGSFGGMIAGRGRGPGELQWPSGVLVDSAYVHVWDGRLARYSRLSQDGRLVFDVTFDWPTQRGQSTSAVEVVSDSSVILAARSEIPPTTPHGRPLVRAAYVQIVAGSPVRDTLYAYESPSSSLVIKFGRARIADPGPRTGPVVFFDGSDKTLVRIDNLAPLQSDMATFSLKRIDRGGQTVHAAEFTTRAYPFSGSEQDSVKRTFRQTLSRIAAGSVPEDELSDVVADLHWPDYWPAVEDAAISRSGDGRIWVKLAGPRGEIESTWVVFNREFVPIGKIHLPFDLQYATPFRDEIWGTTQRSDILVVAGFRAEHISE